MNPLLQSILTGVIRWALGGAFAWLIERGITKPDQTDTIIAAIVTAVGTLGWMVWSKVKEARMLHTAAGTGKAMTVDEVKQTVNAGTFASALTPKGEVPIVKDNTGDGR